MAKGDPISIGFNSDQKLAGLNGEMKVLIPKKAMDGEGTHLAGGLFIFQLDTDRAIGGGAPKAFFDRESNSAGRFRHPRLRVMQISTDSYALAETKSCGSRLAFRQGST